MAQQIVMPQLGEAVVEGKVVEWFVKPGDKVDTGTALLEVETDKANTEVPSTAPGYVSRILVAAGDTVDVGTPLIELVDSEAEVAGGGSSSQAAAPAPEPPKAEPAKAEPPKAEPAKAEPPKQDPPKPTEDAAPSAPATPVSTTPPVPRPPAIPSSNGNAASEPRPWNADSVVAAPTASTASPLPMTQRSDAGAAAVSAAASAMAPPSLASSSAAAEGPSGPFGAPSGMQYFKPPVVRAEEGDNVIPFSKRRGIIAEHMVYSKHVSPHVPCFAECDVTEAMNLRKKHKARLEAQGVRLSLLGFVLKATVQALREFPGVNAVVGAGEIIERQRVNLGVAVETEGGLLVPVIKDADTLSVAGLAKAVDDLATKARTKKITMDDLSGGTFTVTNPGRKGNLFGAAVINQPQVGILRMGEMVRRPVVRKIDGEEVICIRSMMFLSLSYDHRIIDGVLGNGFLYRVRELVEEANFEV